jgi:phospholipid/cholesterol/gamma-HCH transport system ATP-binding protein
MPETAASIELRGLAKSYDGHSIVSGVDLLVAPGDSLVLLGPSGSGKSVLLLQVMGLERPDSGAVLIEGIDISSVGDNEAQAVLQQAHVAVVFQHAALFDWLDLGRNVAFAIRDLPDWEQVKARVKDTLAAVGLAGWEGKPTHNLSGGEKRRVAIARALVGEPGLVL